METDYANIQMYASNNTSAQRFELYYVGNGYYQILSEKSGKSLDVANGSKKQGANVWQYSWNGSEAQLWRIIEGGRRWDIIYSRNWEHFFPLVEYSFIRDECTDELSGGAVKDNNGNLKHLLISR